MTIIEAKVTDQLLTVTNDPVVASGGVKDTSVLFSFCEKWNGFIKTAVFADATKQDWYDVVLDADNKAIVPAQVMATKGRFWFGVVGVKDDITYTAKIVQYDVAEGAAISGEEPEIPQSTIDQILAKVGAHTESTSNPHNVTKEQIGLGNVDNNITDIVNANSRQISNHEKRISNLEARISQEDFVEDGNVAYIKGVPTNALPYAELKKLGGKTRKCANLTTAQKVYNGAYAYLETVVDGRNCIRFASGEAKKNYPITFKENTQYTVSFYKKSENYSGATANNIAFTFWYSDGTQSNVLADRNDTSWTKTTFTSEAGKTVTAVGVGVMEYRAYVYLDIDTFMLNEGTTALPYEPYFEGLRSAPVTEVESVGVNIWDEEWENGYIDLTTGNLLYDANLLRSKSFIMVKPSTTYYMYNGSWNEYRIAFYDNSQKFISPSSANPFTTPSNCRYIKFYWSGTEYKNDICINKSNEAINGKYYPYQRNTLPIPEAVQALDGYGEGIDSSYQNVLDFEKTRYVQWVRRLSQSEKQLKVVTDFSYSNIVYYQLTKTGTVDKGKDTTNILVSNFPIYTKAIGWDNADRIGTVTGASTYDWYWFGFPIGTTLEQAQSVINDCDIVVTLSEAKFTNISDILSDDNLIAVEGGGTMTFKNEHEFAVPSSVIYQVESEVNV